MRTARLFRVQVEKLRPMKRGGYSVAFNCGTDATATDGGCIDQLERAHAKASMVDAILAGGGSKWTVERLLMPSDEWRQMEIQTTN